MIDGLEFKNAVYATEEGQQDLREEIELSLNRENSKSVAHTLCENSL